jgi:hypothetical protein
MEVENQSACCACRSAAVGKRETSNSEPTRVDIRFDNGISHYHFQHYDCLQDVDCYCPSSSPSNHHQDLDCLDHHLQHIDCPNDSDKHQDFDCPYHCLHYKDCTNNRSQHYHRSYYCLHYHDCANDCVYHRLQYHYRHCHSTSTSAIHRDSHSISISNYPSW